MKPPHLPSVVFADGKLLISRRVALGHVVTGLGALALESLTGCKAGDGVNGTVDGGGATGGNGGTGGIGGSAGTAAGHDGGSAGTGDGDAMHDAAIAGDAGGTGGTDAGDAGTALRVSNIANIGPLGAADANGLHLPEGFTSRIVARSGMKPLESADYVWHDAPDGGAVFATEDGGWIYVSNSEMDNASGGVGALRFDAQGTIVDAYRVLDSTDRNCAGGPTPWGAWLSCEEVPKGAVFECDPTGASVAVQRPALGLFRHEAAAIDPVNQHVYLTEDELDGRFYRFVPDGLVDDRADLSAGTLQVAEVAGNGDVTWRDLPDPTYTGPAATRHQVFASTPFIGGEGIWYFNGTVFFSTKGDNRVWAYDVAAEKLDVLYDAANADNPILTGVDNITGSCCGDLLVAEEGGNMEIVAIQPDGTVKALVRIAGHSASEVTGPAFDPSGTRLYFSSQRGAAGEDSDGVTYEVTGPFHLG